MKNISDPIDRVSGPPSRLNTVLSENLSPNLTSLIYFVPIQLSLPFASWKLFYLARSQLGGQLSDRGLWWFYPLPNNILRQIQKMNTISDPHALWIEPIWPPCEQAREVWQCQRFLCHSLAKEFCICVVYCFLLIFSISNISSCNYFLILPHAISWLYLRFMCQVSVLHEAPVFEQVPAKQKLESSS